MRLDSSSDILICMVLSDVSDTTIFTNEERMHKESFLKYKNKNIVLPTNLSDLLIIVYNLHFFDLKTHLV